MIGAVVKQRDPCLLGDGVRQDNDGISARQALQAGPQCGGAGAQIRDDECGRSEHPGGSSQCRDIRHRSYGSRPPFENLQRSPTVGLGHGQQDGTVRERQQSVYAWPAATGRDPAASAWIGVQSRRRDRAGFVLRVQRHHETQLEPYRSPVRTT